MTENQDGLGGFLFPCCCGAGCKQTADFVRAAQMENFQTIVKGCRGQLRRCEAWPEGVEEVDFGGAGKVERKGCKS